MLWNSKYLILCNYLPLSPIELTYVSEIQKVFTYYHSSYDNIFLLGELICHFLEKMQRTCVICDIDLFWFRHFVKVQQNLYTTDLIKTIIKKSSKMF